MLHVRMWLGVAALGLSCTQVLAQAFPSAQSPTCNALCDLVTTVGAAFKGEPGQSRQAEPSSQPAAAAVSAAPPRGKARRPLRPVVAVAHAKTAPPQPVQFVVSASIRSLDDLDRKQVSLGPAGTEGARRARTALERQSIVVEETPLDFANAVDALTLGAIQAVAVTDEKQRAAILKLPTSAGLHLVAARKVAARSAGRDRS